MRPDHDLEPHRGPLILTLGLLGLLLCPLLGPIAWILGRAELESIRAGWRDPQGRSLAQAGMVCGIVGTASLVLVLFSALLVIMLALVREF